MYLCRRQWYKFNYTFVFPQGVVQVRPPPGFEGEVPKRESLPEVASCWRGSLVPQPLAWGLGTGYSQGGEDQGLLALKVSSTFLLLKTIDRLSLS